MNNLKNNIENKVKYNNRLGAGKYKDCIITKCEFNNDRFIFTINKDGKEKMFSIMINNKYADLKLSNIIEKNKLYDEVMKLDDNNFNINLALLLTNKLIDVELKWIDVKDKKVLVVSICK